MKKTGILAVIFCLSTLSISAQSYIDALRFSQYQYIGTARSQAMGGAFGALGGDFSAISLNPGGLGVYRSNEFAITTSFNSNTNDSKYLGSSRSDVKYNFNIPHLGMVYNFNTGNDEGFISYNIAFGMNQLNQFHTNQIIEGVNSNENLIDFFENNANRNIISPENLDPYWEGLAFDSYLMDIDSISGYYYSNFIPPVNQKKNISTTGNTREYLFGFGTNYNNKLYLGFSLGITSSYYYYESNHTETYLGDLPQDIQTFRFNQTLTTNASGFTLKAGAIFRPIESLRIGATFHLPTFYSMMEEFNAKMFTNYNSQPIRPFDGYSLLPAGTNSYSLETPFRFIGSLAYMLNKSGILSLDYEYADYSQMKLRDGVDSYDYYDENNEINQAMKATHNIRAGAEARFGSMYLRGGYGFMMSPYSSSEKNQYSDINTISTGFGYRDSKFFADFAIVRAMQTLRDKLYPFEYASYYTNNYATNRFVATFGFRF